MFVIALPLMFGTAPKIFNDGDTGWHLATGQWIIDHRAVPTADPFSYTMPGAPWVAHEWLSDVLLAAAYRGAGYAGVATLVTLALTATMLIVFRHLQARVGPTATFFGLVSIFLVVAPFTLARPHVLVWPIVAWWTASLIDASEQGRSPPRWLPLLMILWVNLHGSFVLGFIILGALALDAWWSRGAALGPWIFSGLFCAIATLVNANGFETLVFPFTVSNMETLHLIAEWLPSSFRRTPVSVTLFALVAALILVRRPRDAPFRWLLIATLSVMAIQHLRHQSWLAIVAALILPPLLASRRSKPKPQQPSDVGVGRTVSAIVLALPLIVVPFLPIAPREGLGNPVSLLAAVPDDLRTQPVFNQYSFGGPLILAGIRPFIDGRADMYGDAYFRDFDAVADGDWPKFQRAVARYRIRWTMLHRDDRKLIRALDKAPDWRRLKTTPVGVIHIRTSR